MDGDFTLHRAGGDEISAAELYAALRLRAEVFVVEQECTYLDPDGRDLDRDTSHLWFTDDAGEVVAYVRVLAESSGGDRIGRVVTAPAHRGRGLTGRLIDHALTWTRRPVVLDAQSHLVPIYERHGFAPHGAAFVEDGIAHTPMRLG